MIIESGVMGDVANKRVLLGVSGGIAAYKSAELVRLLRREGAEVRVVMTAAATQFITPLTLQALSGHTVHHQLLDETSEAAMSHITLARWAERIVIAPATADLLARLAQGQANDLLTTLCLASEAPLYLAPAMNHKMWQHPATQANCQLLLQRGAQLLGPASGEQACGEVGTGRMVEPAEIVTAVIGSFTPGALTGVKVVVTAGPTREALDPVRYISNRSSGKMGFAVAAAAARAGATVTLIAGPVSLATPAGVVRIDVVTAEEMYAAVLAAQTACDILIAAAAVADYRAKTVVPQKIKKSGASLTLELVPNRDILASITAQSPRPFVVGFAAETERLLENARLKLERKALDVVAANSVVNAASGFEVDHNALTVLWPDGSAELPLMHKTLLAERLIELIVERYRAKSRS